MSEPPPSPGTSHPAVGWHAAPDGTARCLLCPHACRLAPGEAGLCRVRRNVDGELISTAYGRPVLVSATPIEQRGLLHVWPGSRALALGTAGCNLRCGFCLNHRVSQAAAQLDAAPVAPAQIVARALAAGARAIAFTYNEPLVYLEYLIDIAKAARQAGLGLVAKSNGFWSETGAALLAPWLDAVNIDLKGWDEGRHRHLVGGPLAPVLDTLRALRRRGVWIEISTPLTPGLCDDRRSLSAIAHFIATDLGPQTPWHLLRFYPGHGMSDRLPSAVEALQHAMDIGRQQGLQHVYSPTLDAIGGMDTACAGCGQVIIRRRRGRPVDARLRSGRCPTCARQAQGLGLGEDSGARLPGEPSSSIDAECARTIRRSGSA